ncbi:tryptophan synthase subunit alpha [Bacillus testis]|uniref:tryptophan synthase subunit alpha n=1 Tax=Bacillus testis TaxID=1622072 RepID=UPI00067EFD38|nr:tryptophan synthase subunit alpha [Bacillus testis]
MSRIETVIRRVNESGKKCFVPYIMAGDGGLDRLLPTLKLLQEAGATMIEIGIPFSDPAADGPVIQEAGKRALAEGTTLPGIFEALRDVREHIHIPLIFMTYFNPILAMGAASFAQSCAALEIDGCIIPDLPLEEEVEIKPYLQPYKIDLIRLASITSPLQRLQALADGAEGFLYAVAVKGVTGVREKTEASSLAYIRRLAGLSSIPVLAGFGISSPGQARQMGEACAGVIVGSQIINHLQEGKIKEIEDFIHGANGIGMRE